MWTCDNCGKSFDEPRELTTTYEDYYGVGSEFDSKTWMTYGVCPYCGCEDITEECDDEEEEDMDG